MTMDDELFNTSRMHVHGQNSKKKEAYNMTPVNITDYDVSETDNVSDITYRDREDAKS